MYLVTQNIVRIFVLPKNKNEKINKVYKRANGNRCR